MSGKCKAPCTAGTRMAFAAGTQERTTRSDSSDRQSRPREMSAARRIRFAVTKIDPAQATKTTG